jgi:hypothetical protein
LPDWDSFAFGFSFSFSAVLEQNTGEAGATPVACFIAEDHMLPVSTGTVFAPRRNG